MKGTGFSPDLIPGDWLLTFRICTVPAFCRSGCDFHGFRHVNNRTFSYKLEHDDISLQELAYPNLPGQVEPNGNAPEHGWRGQGFKGNAERYASLLPH